LRVGCGCTPLNPKRNPHRRSRQSAVLTTAGFRDVLEVGRDNRTILSNIKAVRPPPLVTPCSRVFEIDERSYYDGTIARAADRP
jgi:N-methylhydantoinase A